MGRGCLLSPPSPPRVFLKGWDRQSIFMMQFIIHTGCLHTYGVAFVCQGAGCFMTVTAGICIGGCLLASSLSSSRIKIDTALWECRGGRSWGIVSPEGWVPLAGNNAHPFGMGEMLSPWGGGLIPSRVTDPSPISLHRYQGPPCSEGCSVWRSLLSQGIIPTERVSGTPRPGTKGSLSVGQPHPQGQKGQVKGTKPSLVSPS